MSDITPELRSLALHLRWECALRSEDEATSRLTERARKFTREQCAEAWRAAAVLDGAAFELAAAWFESRGQTSPMNVAELELLCPGFFAEDYALAIQHNLLQARK